MFESYENWKQSHEVDVTLRCMYEAMKRSSGHHDQSGSQAWRRRTWAYHVNKAWFHLMPQWENKEGIAIDTVVKKSTDDKEHAPPTLLPHAILALTRLHFTVNHWATQGLLGFIPVAQPVVDVREEEQSGE